MKRANPELPTNDDRSAKKPKRSSDGNLVSIQSLRSAVPDDLKDKVVIKWHKRPEDEMAPRRKYDPERSKIEGRINFDTGIKIIFKKDTSLNDDSVRKMLKSLRVLVREIDLGEDNLHIIKLLDRGLPIESLSFQYDPDADIDLEAFSKIHQGSLLSLKVSEVGIDHLSLSDGSQSPLMKFIGKFFNLTTLVMLGNEESGNRHFDCRIFNNLTHLKHLDLSHYADISETDINNMVGLMPDLRSVKFFKGYRVQNDQCLQTFFASQRKLQTVFLESFVDVDTNPSITNSLLVMAQNNPNLTNLNIEESKITDDNLLIFINSLADCCKSLETLNIKDCLIDEEEEDEQF